MSSLWTITYMVAVIIFIGWLLHRVRCLHRDYRGSHGAAAPPARVGRSTVRDHLATAYTDNDVDRAATSPAVARRDDLTRIKGIGEVITRKLHAMGIVSFQQIARLTDKNIEDINRVLSFKGRIERDDWIGQARRLLAVRRSE